jgi:hypothetical protein
MDARDIASAAPWPRPVLHAANHHQLDANAWRISCLTSRSSPRRAADDHEIRRFQFVRGASPHGAAGVEDLRVLVNRDEGRRLNVVTEPGALPIG